MSIVKDTQQQYVGGAHIYMLNRCTVHGTSAQAYIN